MPDFNDIQQKANNLLKQKYEEDLASETLKYGCISKSTSPPAANWEFVANERLQFLSQIRDECHAWQIAYLEEKNRSAELQAALFKALGLSSVENSEEKVVVKTAAQVSKRHANFSTVRKIVEERLAQGDKTNEEDEQHA